MNDNKKSFFQLVFENIFGTKERVEDNSSKQKEQDMEETLEFDIEEVFIDATEMVVEQKNTHSIGDRGFENLKHIEELKKSIALLLKNREEIQNTQRFSDIYKILPDVHCDLNEAHFQDRTIHMNSDVGKEILVRIYKGISKVQDTKIVLHDFKETPYEYLVSIAIPDSRKDLMKKAKKYIEREFTPTNQIRRNEINIYKKEHYILRIPKFDTLSRKVKYVSFLNMLKLKEKVDRLSDKHILGYLKEEDTVSLLEENPQCLTIVGDYSELLDTDNIDILKSGYSFTRNYHNYATYHLLQKELEGNSLYIVLDKEEEGITSVFHYLKYHPYTLLYTHDTEELFRTLQTLKEQINVWQSYPEMQDKNIIILINNLNIITEQEMIYLKDIQCNLNSSIPNKISWVQLTQKQLAPEVENYLHEQESTQLVLKETITPTGDMNNWLDISKGSILTYRGKQIHTGIPFDPLYLRNIWNGIVYLKRSALFVDEQVLRSIEGFQNKYYRIQQDISKEYYEKKIKYGNVFETS